MAWKVYSINIIIGPRPNDVRLTSGFPIPTVDGYRAIGEPPRGDELPNSTLNRSQRLMPLNEKILQGGQHAHSLPDEFLQGGHKAKSNVMG
jgi:hypothetical protein